MRGPCQGLYRCLVVLWLVCVPGLVVAQVSMEARLGLQGAVRLGRWNQVSVVLHNTGPPVTGVLGVRTWRGSQETRGDLHIPVFTRPVELPHGARKRFTFVVPIASTTYPVEVFLRTPDAVILQQQLDLREAFHTEHLVVGVTSDLGLDTLATAFQTSMPIRVVYLAPTDLPSSWYGYDSVSAVVVKGISLQALTEDQTTALRQWLGRGGTLVVAGDAQYAVLKEPRLRALLPVQVEGLQLATLAAFGERYGVPVPALPGLAVKARFSSGQLLLGDEETTLLAQRPFGRGRVVFLAVDYATQPFLGWQGSTALWKEMLQLADNVDYSRTFAELGLTDESHPMLKLLQRQILTYPSHLLLTVFLAGYFGCLAVLFWRIGKKRTPHRRLWLAVLLVIGGFSVAAATVFPEQHLRQPALCFDMTIMEVLPDTEYSHTQGYLGLFSATGGVFSLALQQPTTILRHAFTRGVGSAGREFEVTTTGPVQVRHLALEPWTLRLFNTESMIPAVLRVKTQRHASGVSVHLHNVGTVPLENALVLYRGKLLPLGVVRPGEAMLENLSPTLPGADNTQDTLWRMLHKHSLLSTAEGRAGYLQEVLLQQYFGEKRLVDVSNAANQTLFIVGWLQHPGTVTPTAPGIATWGITLVVSRLTL